MFLYQNTIEIYQIQWNINMPLFYVFNGMIQKLLSLVFCTTYKMPFCQREINVRVAVHLESRYFILLTIVLRF